MELKKCKICGLKEDEDGWCEYCSKMELKNFKPKKNIKAWELAEIIRCMNLTIDEEIYSFLSDETQRHFS